MITPCSLSLAALLTFGHIVPALVRSTSHSATSDDERCAQEMKVLDPHAHGAHVTVATVLYVDHQLGVLHLETEIGRLLTFVAPEKITDVREGEQLRVCLAEPEPAEQQPHGTIPARPLRSERGRVFSLSPSLL
jgi:hypothetical protein